MNRIQRPSTWIALIPVMLIPCCWLWWFCGGFNPGLQPGRSGQILLILGAVLAWRHLPGMTLPVAALPLLLSLAWQGLTQTWSPIPEPGMLILVCRAAAFATALGVGAWLMRRPEAGVPAAMGLAGLGVLILNVLTPESPGLDLGRVLRLGYDAPFGNVNYAVHVGLPLAMVGVAFLLRTSRRQAWMLGAATLTLSLMLGLGVAGSSPTRAIWLIAAAAVAAILVLRAPPRMHGTLLLLGAVAIIIGWLASFTGALDPSAQGTGNAQRIYMWRAASEALMGPQALVGYGPGSCLAILPEQPSFSGFWLSWPCWASHPHNEILNVLLEGGVVLAGLLAWALWSTLRPLWLRRDDPACSALLVGWVAAGCGAMVDGHLHEPGGLLGLALLAGLTWAHAPAEDRRLHLSPWLWLVPALALTLSVSRELLGDGGAPVSIHRRTVSRLATEDAAAQLDELERMRRRLGPLDTTDFARAHVLGRLGRLDESMALLAAYLRRLPVDGTAVELAARIRAAGKASPELQAAELHARQLAGAWLGAVPESHLNAAALERLKKVLATDGPDQAH